jgi:hypothetical protein
MDTVMLEDRVVRAVAACNALVRCLALESFELHRGAPAGTDALAWLRLHALKQEPMRLVLSHHDIATQEVRQVSLGLRDV